MSAARYLGFKMSCTLVTALLKEKEIGCKFTCGPFGSRLCFQLGCCTKREQIVQNGFQVTRSRIPAMLTVMSSQKVPVEAEQRLGNLAQFFSWL